MELPYEFVALKASFKPAGITGGVLLELLGGSNFFEKFKTFYVRDIFK